MDTIPGDKFSEYGSLFYAYPRLKMICVMMGGGGTGKRMEIGGG